MKQQLICLARLIIFSVFFAGISAHVSAQSLVSSDDPRELALDIFGGITRGGPPEATAAQIQSLVQAFRFRCTRLTDYQIFSLRPNIIDFKVKCSGDPLYGVTVASNGYVSVFGGNGMLSGLNRTDSLIYSFDNEGEFAYDSSLTVNQALGETVERIDFEDQVNVISIFGIFSTILAFVLVIAIVWWRAWKFKQARKPRQRMKPMARHRVGAKSSVKDLLLEQSREVTKHVFKHPEGFYIARGKRGKRRFFNSFFWAKMYASRGLRLFEISAPEDAHEMVGEAEA